jgi:hypothetical protein
MLQRVCDALQDGRFGAMMTAPAATFSTRGLPDEQIT